MLGTVSTFPRISQLDLSSLWMTVAAATLALTGCIVLYAYEPGGSGLFPSCPFRAITGLHCPGCGTLRGLHQLLHGNLVGAFDFNPLMVLAIPFIGHAVMSDMVFKPTFPIWLKSFLSNSSMVLQPLANYGPFLRAPSYNNSMICHFAVRCRRHHGGT